MEGNQAVAGWSGDDSDDLDEYLAELGEEALPEFTGVGEETSEARERMWCQFCEFFERRENPINPISIWEGLCMNQIRAQKLCQAFLMHYVKKNMGMRPMLYNDGMERFKLVKSGGTVEKIWRGLVGYADATILSKKRQEEPHNAHKWTLKFTDVKQGRLSGSVSQITDWIPTSLAKENDLTREQTFEKRQATTEDITLILSTLWKRAKDIRFSPRLRVAFHSALLLCAMAGFRMGVVQGLKYKQVQMAFARQNDSEKLHLVATITLEQNKRRKNKNEKTQAGIVSLSVTFVPCKPLCLLSLLVATALADNAFEVPFDSFETLLSRPRLEPGVNYLPLKWREEFQDRSIIDLSYNQYWTIWSKTVHVAGVREGLRPYATRVGAGQRLDAVLEPALRNYILSNSQRTFERSYQPRHISVDLARLSFGDNGSTPETKKLFELLSQACMARDEKAPVALTRDEKLKVESHKYIMDLTKAYHDLHRVYGFEDIATRKAWGKMRWEKKSYENRLLNEKRQQYFDEADRLRALGAADDILQHPTMISATRHQLADAGTLSISEFMHRDDLGGEIRQQKFVDMMFEFMAHRPANTDYIFRDIIEEASGLREPLKPIPDSQTNFRCLFGCQSFTKRDNLVKHIEALHEPSFDTPFGCPECRRLRRPLIIIKGLEHWCVHAEREHGHKNAPSHSSQLKYALVKRYEKPEKVRCLLCKAKFCVGQGYSRHFERRHALRDFQNPKGFPCPECRHECNKDVIIHGVEFWKRHTCNVHGIDAVRGIAPGQTLRRKKVVPTRHDKKMAVRKVVLDGAGSMEHAASDNAAGHDRMDIGANSGLLVADRSDFSGAYCTDHTIMDLDPPTLDLDNDCLDPSQGSMIIFAKQTSEGPAEQDPTAFAIYHSTTQVGELDPFLPATYSDKPDMDYLGNEEIQGDGHTTEVSLEDNSEGVNGQPCVAFDMFDEPDSYTKITEQLLAVNSVEHNP